MHISLTFCAFVVILYIRFLKVYVYFRVNSMSENLINILALIFLCIGVFCIFWRRDMLKDKTSNWKVTASGFVVSCISLLIIYFVNR